MGIVEYLIAKAHFCDLCKLPPKTSTFYMEAFLIRINIAIFHKHESIDGKGVSRRNKNFTSYLYR